jgi:aspartate-semialdehyde dehydrogenase
MGERGFRIAVLGATGAVGAEIIDILEERSFPVAELLPFASTGESQIEFQGEDVAVRAFDPVELGRSELVFCASAELRMDRILEHARAEELRLIDLSGALELDPSVPLHLPGLTPSLPAESPRIAAIPRGVAAGLALALAPLAREVELTRATMVCLDPAVGVGREGVGELTAHTSEILNRMTGEIAESELFPHSLAFECLPLVGALQEDGSSSEEQRLAHVLRRLLGAPGLPIEATRIRVPTFSGSLATVHLSLARGLSVARAKAIWEKQPMLRVLDVDSLPTPRGALGHDEVAIGRIRQGGEAEPGLAFALALDDLRRGAALAAVETAEALCR